MKTSALIDTGKPRNHVQTGLTTADVTSLCDAAAVAWGALPGDRRKAPFMWRGKKYVATHPAFQLLVHTVGGLPVARRGG